METVHYRVRQEERGEFMAAMSEVRKVRGRAGAMFWQLYEDVAHPGGLDGGLVDGELDRPSARGDAAVGR
ncbi:MAG: MFS transporter [Acetobacteraceae bacterium]